MNKNMHKRIIGLLIIVFAFVIYTPYDVFACNANDDACIKTCNAAREKLETKDYTNYGVSIDYDVKTDTFTVKRGKIAKALQTKLSKKGISDPTFKIVQITLDDSYDTEPASYSRTYTSEAAEFKEIIKTNTISGKQTVTFSRTEFEKRLSADQALRTVTLLLQPVGFTDPDLESACQTKEVYFSIIVSKSVNLFKNGGGVKDLSDRYKIDELTGTSSTLNCDNPSIYPAGDFRREFCIEWNKAAAAGAEIKKFSKANSYSEKPLQLYCKTQINSEDDVFEESIFLADGKTPNPKYYKNTNYFRGETTETKDFGRYEYHAEYSGYESVPATCEVYCREVVTVEYGAPIASKGGFCFEYKVRVTSRVNCDLKNPPPKPETPKVCTPTPVCYDGSSSSSSTVRHNQGGPSEDFDRCIKNCDGGKYTEKCSDKCYKQVYGKSKTVAGIRKTTGYELSYATKVRNEREVYHAEDKHPTDASENECIYQKNASTGDVNWITKGSSEEKAIRMDSDGNIINCDSTWHVNTDFWGFWSSVYSGYRSSGIPTTDTCTETCVWDASECDNQSGYVYLNDAETYNRYHKDTIKYDKDGKTVKVKTQYEIDMERNLEIYNQLKANCEAAATCNTTTAEITISANYKQKGKETKWEYPYSTKENVDKIKYENKNLTTCTDDNNFTTLLSSAGCYNCGKATSEQKYQIEWSFPGIWKYKKGNERSYTGQGINIDDYTLWPYKFCLPWSVDNVNTKWFDYYQGSVHTRNTSISYFNDEYAGKITCPDGSTKDCGLIDQYKNAKFTEEDAKPIKDGGSTDYNINASTRSFGYFGWDIDINCFYAVHDQTCSCEGKPDCTPGDPGCPKKSDANYNIRTVDLENVINDAEGNKLSSPDTTGRTPGFNWSEYATQANKDPSYSSFPKNYLTYIQTKGYSIYDDQNIDYEVVLTKEKITQIRKSNVKYTEWKGIVNDPSKAVEQSAGTYRSPLVKEGVITVYPEAETTLKCNNISEHNATAGYKAACQDFSKEVK